MQRSDWQKILDLFCSNDSNDWELGFLLLRSSLDNSPNKDQLLSLLLGVILFGTSKTETSHHQFHQKLRRFLAKKDAYFFRKFSILQYKIFNITNKYIDSPNIQYQKMMELLNFSRFSFEVLCPIFNAQLATVANRQRPLVLWQLTFLLINNQLSPATVKHCLLYKLQANIGTTSSAVSSYTYLNLYCYIPQSAPQLDQLLQENDRITFSRNSLQELPQALYKNKQLFTLTIDRNPIKSLGDDLSHWEKLCELNIDSCRHLKHFPTSMATLNKLLTLSIKHCRLTTIPAVFFQLTALRQLELSQNRLQNIPNKFDQLPYLRFLNLTQNATLYELPSSIYKLPHLERLWAKDCGLNKLDKDIIQLTTLQDLRLSQNGIKYLPKNFSHLKELTTLHLDRTLIRCNETFWETILALPKLKYLKLLGVRIRADIYTQYKDALVQKLSHFEINAYYLY